MIEAGSEALEYVQGKCREDLDHDRPLQHLLVRNLEIFGEAASRTSPQFRADHPEIPWQRIISTRNRLTHVYFDVDLDTIWSTVHNGLPDVLPRLEALLESRA